MQYHYVENCTCSCVRKTTLALEVGKCCASANFSLRKNICVACPLVQIQTHMLRIYKFFVAHLQNFCCAFTKPKLRYHKFFFAQKHFGGLSSCGNTNSNLAHLQNYCCAVTWANTIVTLRYNWHNVAFLQAKCCIIMNKLLCYYHYFVIFPQTKTCATTKFIL